MDISLRIRHPSIDPTEISEALGLEPRHSFKAGEVREASSGGSAGRHGQTYWLAPLEWPSSASLIEPSFLEATQARHPERDIKGLVEKIRSARKTSLDSSVETALFVALAQLNLRAAFLQQLLGEGGAVSLLIVLPPQSQDGFKIPLALSRLVVKLGIDLEFEVAEE